MQDIEAFTARIKALRRDALASVGRADYYHMRAIETLGRGLFLFGLFACYRQWLWASVPALAMTLMIKWLLMHHIGHGGYDRIPNIPSRYHSSRYALGWRRYLDWFDWIKPEAWNHEHNYLHHYFTGEDKDPDLVERNLDWLAGARLPLAAKLLVLAFFAASWKFTYYSARTLSCLTGQTIDFGNFVDLRGQAQRRMWFELFLPYLLAHFVLLPLGLELLADGFGQTYLLSRVLAEILHNVHTFVVIVPNHAGDDIHRFEHIASDRRGGGYFYLRQILGSANYRTGGEWNDLCHMYLNYQIEHHLFPNLPMRQYRRIQPQVKALCAEFGLPYLQQSVWQRLVKMIQIAVGSKRMLRSPATLAAATSETSN